MRIEIVQSGNLIQVNGHTFHFEDRTLIIEDISTLAPKIHGLSDFDRLLDSVISKTKRIAFLKYLYDNSQAGVKELQDHINVDRSIILYVIKIGYETGLIVKKGQWRLIAEKRDAIGKYLDIEIPKPEDETTILDEIQGQSIARDPFEEMMHEDAPVVSNVMKKKGYKK